MDEITVPGTPTQEVGMTCTGVDPQECVLHFPASFYVQDRGNVSVGLTIIIALLAMTFTAFCFNIFSPKRV